MVDFDASRLRPDARFVEVACDFCGQQHMWTRSDGGEDRLVPIPLNVCIIPARLP